MKIATAQKGHTAKNWKNEDLDWDQIVGRAKDFKRAGVTRAEFDKLSKDEQTNIKNMGGAFVGGELKDGLRKKGNVVSRSLITLDIDHATPEVFKNIESYSDCSGVTTLVYTTFKSTAAAPRLRVIIPLKAPIKEPFYEPIARKLALTMDVLELCDPASFRANQLMFWPCYPKDAEPYIKENKFLPLDTTEIVNSYENIDDFRSWPMQESEKVKRQSELMAEDPLTKPYPIGTFCRAYGIEEAIRKFLPKVYEQVSADRWHLKVADSSAGAVVYDDKFFYSHHSSDPAYGIECNAFDLVRIHKFGALDDKARAGTPFNKLPSFKAMMDLAAKDKRVSKLQLQEDGIDVYITDREEIKRIEEDPTTDWQQDLEKDKAGNVKSTLANIGSIIKNDARLQAIKYDLFADCFCVDGQLPWEHEGRGWTEADLSNLCMFLSQQYGLNATANVFTALTATVRNCRAYHPVREYLLKQKWDGKRRLDKLFITYLGAENSELNRVITRKTFIAAVARVFEPGVKFDTMTVLVGGQGIGKSTILKLMGGEWFSDSLTLSDMKDKNGVEKLNGSWISEIAELSGMRKTDSETIKGFITRRDDRMRPAYGHTVVSKPRQGIFIGTTNELEGFLRDLTGNRRYWPIIVNGYSDFSPEKWNLTPEKIGQIWAEATEAYRAKEPLYLPKNLQDAMTLRQEGLLESDSRMGAVQKYLDMRLPREWPNMKLSDRLDFIRGQDFPKHQAVAIRDKVSAAEVWCECFEESISRLGRRESNEIVAMLIKLGWKRSERIRRTALYGVQRYFTRPVQFAGPVQNDQEIETVEEKKDKFRGVEDLITVEEMLQ